MGKENIMEEIKEKIRKLPMEKIEEVKRILREIKKLKEAGKDEYDNDILSKYMEFKILLR